MNEEKLATKADLKEFYTRILPYLGGSGSGGSILSYVYKSTTALSTTLGNTTTVTLANLFEADDNTVHPTADNINIGKTVVFDAAGTLGIATAISGSNVTVTTMVISDTGDGVELTGTLSAGQTSITFNNAAITLTSTIDVYTDADVDYNSISTSVGSITITFDAQASNLGVKVRVS